MALTANIVQGINTVGSSVNQASALKAQGEYNKRVSDINAGKAEAQAADVVKQGETNASARLSMTRKQEGAQKAAIAAGGGDVNSEAAQNILSETQNIGAADIQAIKSNAWREAWGIKSQAEGIKLEGETSSIANKYAARQTLITGGLEGLAYGAKGYGEINKRKAATKMPTSGGTT